MSIIQGANMGRLKSAMMDVGEEAMEIGIEAASMKHHLTEDDVKLAYYLLVASKANGNNSFKKGTFKVLYCTKFDSLDKNLPTMAEHVHVLPRNYVGQ